MEERTIHGKVSAISDKREVTWPFLLEPPHSPSPSELNHRSQSGVYTSRFFFINVTEHVWIIKHILFNADYLRILCNTIIWYEFLYKLVFSLNKMLSFIWISCILLWFHTFAQPLAFHCITIYWSILPLIVIGVVSSFSAILNNAIFLYMHPATYMPSFLEDIYPAGKRLGHTVEERRH